MKQEVQYLLEIIKYILNRKQGEIMVPAKDMDWERLIQLAKEHSILNCVYYGVDALAQEHKPDEAKCDILYKALVNSVVRNYNQIEGVKELFEAFEEEGIYALAVKGICTKQHYPQTDMRTMGDIDILYQPQQDAKVKKVMKQLGYDEHVEGRQHDCYSRKPYLAVEMHRELVGVDSIYNSYYKTIWERVKPKENCQYVQEMTLEDEYIYTLVHLARHFQDGGIGIRFVIDVYVYNHLKGMDWKYVESELRKLQLWEFYGNISKLAEMWFGEEMPSQEEKELLDKLATYVIANGTFGSTRNAAAVTVAKNGRVQFLWKAIFPNLKNMQSMFVWLEKWPILLPYAWVLRGVKSVISRRRHIKTQFYKYKNGDKEYGKELQRFYKACGLEQRGKVSGCNNLLCECIRHEIDNDYTISKRNITDYEFQELYQLATKHDLAHFVSVALKDELKNSKYNHLYYECMLYAVYRYEQKRYVREQISKVFEEEKIPHIFLKGSVLAEYYPESWLRTSCDIDVLIKKEDLDKAIDVLVKKLRFVFEKKDSHDVSFYSEPDVHIELHYDLIEVVAKYDQTLAKVWETSKLASESNYEYVMTDEMFYFYHLAHMAKHFAHGGCGIRSFLDVWILNHKVLHDKEKRVNLLEEGQLSKFAEVVQMLSEVWFGNGTHNHTTNLMEQYILDGGVYGDLKNRVLIQRTQCKNEFHFIMRRVFMPYKEMSLEYPILQKKPYLLPIYWVIRWFKCLKNNRVSRGVEEFKINSSAMNYRYSEIDDLVKTLEIEIPKG